MMLFGHLSVMRYAMTGAAAPMRKKNESAVVVKRRKKEKIKCQYAGLHQEHMKLINK